MTSLIDHDMSNKYMEKFRDQTDSKFSKELDLLDISQFLEFDNKIYERFSELVRIIEET